MNFQEGAYIYINKPYRMSSFGALAHIRYVLSKRLHVKRVKMGHAGTLDPLATGVLVLCTGKATKQIEALHVQRGFELPETEGFPHAGRSSENANPADVLQIGKAVHHRFLIGGLKGIRYLQGMFVKRVAGQAVESFEIHETSSPSEG